MAPVPPAAFRELLAERSRSSFAAFVADLYAARGREVTRDGGRVVVDGDRVLAPVGAPADGTALGEADAAVGDAESTAPTLVSATPTDDAAAVGPDDLRRMLLYDVPRDRAAALFERHFDRALDGEWPSPTPDPVVAGGSDDLEGTAPRAWPESGDDGAAAGAARNPGGADTGDVEGDADDGTPGERTSWRRRLSVGGGSRRAAAATLLVFALVGAAVAAPAVGPGERVLGGATTTPTGSGTPHRAPTATATEMETLPHSFPDKGTPATGAAEAPEPNATYPPGVSSQGVGDVDALAAAHVRQVTTRSYELEIRYREFREGTPSGEMREVVRVGNRTVYVSDVSVSGVLLDEPRAVSVVETYADGAVRYERRVRSSDPVGTARATRTLADVESPFAGRVGELVWTRLGARQTRVVGRSVDDGVTKYLVAFRGERYVGSARVDENGVVHELRWRFTPEDTPRLTAEVLVRYEFGNVTVAEPGWVADARNATGG